MWQRRLLLHSNHYKIPGQNSKLRTRLTLGSIGSPRAAGTCCPGHPDQTLWSFSVWHWDTGGTSWRRSYRCPARGGSNASRLPPPTTGPPSAAGPCWRSLPGCRTASPGQRGSSRCCPYAPPLRCEESRRGGSTNCWAAIPASSWCSAATACPAPPPGRRPSQPTSASLCWPPGREKVSASATHGSRAPCSRPQAWPTLLRDPWVAPPPLSRQIDKLLFLSAVRWLERIVVPQAFAWTWRSLGERSREHTDVTDVCNKSKLPGWGGRNTDCLQMTGIFHVFSSSLKVHAAVKIFPQSPSLKKSFWGVNTIMRNKVAYQLD